MTIKELYKRQMGIWKNENEKYFGLSPLEQWKNAEIIKKHLDECANKFWNNGTNKFKELLENGRMNDFDKMIPGSYELVFDQENMIVCLFGTFKYKPVQRNKANVEEVTQRSIIAYLPYVTDLCWGITGSLYVLRVTAEPNYALLDNRGDLTKYRRTWSYDHATKEFYSKYEIEDYFNNMGVGNHEKINREFLRTYLGEDLTPENFKEALEKIPQIDHESVCDFVFTYVDEIFAILEQSKRFANPIKKIPVPINFVKMMNSRNSYRSQNDDSASNMVLAENNISSLENSRTVIYKSRYNTTFNFKDSEKVFDAFKTSTNKSAGRSRLLLDDVIVKDGMLYNLMDNGEYCSMFEIKKNEELGLASNVSILSNSRFNSNNDPKRIMMNAKLRTQAVEILGEDDRFTHEIPARIVFGDFEGFNYGDAIIVSRSFAKKLNRIITVRRRIYNAKYYKEIKDRLIVGTYLSPKEFTNLTLTTMNNNLRYIKIASINSEYIEVDAIAPFSVGDKLTNMHGSKGLCCIIKNDEDMPKLVNDVSDQFKAGPFDVVVSGLSVYHRKSLGQLFEGWALATGHNDVTNIPDAVDKYYDSIKEFNEKSLVELNGVVTNKPCGINMMIRLHHDAVTKVSLSYLKSNSGKSLKFGEMELLNLAARGKTAIINELDVRSGTKHIGAFTKIYEMQTTGELDVEPANNMRFFSYFRSLGLDFKIDDEYVNASVIPNHSLDEAYNLVSDDAVDLFKD